jgi:hypothetical protein
MKLFITIFLVIKSSLCWWDSGHIIVAQIAEITLKELSKIKIT